MQKRKFLPTVEDIEKRQLLTVIAVIDSGSDPSPGVHYYRPFNIATQDQRQSDPTGHGTLVANTIAVASGYDPTIQVMPVQIPTYNAVTFDIAVHYAVAAGANVINFSAASVGKPAAIDTSLFGDAFRFAAKHNVPIVVGAGNDSVDIDTTSVIPSSMQAKGVFQSVAVNPDGSLASFSNWSNRPSAFATPGVGIRTVDVNGTPLVVRGTSFSPAVLDVTLARLIQANPKAKVASMGAMLQIQAHDDHLLDGLVYHGQEIDHAPTLGQLVPMPRHFFKFRGKHR